jgi:uncharacterized phosphosugar-binding protein
VKNNMEMKKSAIRVGPKPSNPAKRYFKTMQNIIDRLEPQQIIGAARLIESSLKGGHIIHVFGAGHSALLAEEVFFRAGGLVPVRPVLDAGLRFENGVIESTEFERRKESARKLSKDANFEAGDTGIVISNSGRNALPVEMALQMRSAGMKVIALTNLRQSRASQSLHPSGKRLFEVTDAILDNHCPVGDAAIKIAGIQSAMGPASTIAGAAVLNAVFLQAAAQLASAGTPPAVFVSVNMEEESLDGLKALIAPYEDKIQYYRSARNRKQEMATH